MAIILDNNSNFELDDSLIQLFNKLIDETVKVEKCPYDVEVSIIITNNDEIKVMNKQFRNIDSATDVLSFPQIDFNNPSDFTCIDNSDLDFNLDSDELIIGDIVISIDKAKDQALEYGHSLERELGFLVIHSMLHLFGYDHIDEKDSKIMFTKQKLF